MTQIRIFGALTMLVASAALASPALAAPPADEVAPRAAATAGAVVLFKRGVVAMKRGDWQAAYDAFLAAWKIKEHYRIGAQLARAELKLGKHRDAAEHLARILNEVEDLSPEDRALVQEMLNEAKKRIATVTILVNREGAEVLVDGAAVGESPLSFDVYVEPGERTFEARVPGEAAQNVTVELAEGQARQVGLRFGVKEEAVEKPLAISPVREEVDERFWFGGDKRVLMAGGVATGVGVLSGVAFAIASDMRASQTDGSAGRDATIFKNVAFWSFVGAGATATATLLYGLAAPIPRATETGAHVIPVAAAGSGGVVVTGRW